MIVIEKEHLKIVRSVLKKYLHGCEVWAFGSRVNKKPKKYSDLDLAIKTDSALPVLVIASLRDAFSETNLPFKVDIVEWSKISDEFKKIIEDNFEILKF